MRVCVRLKKIRENKSESFSMNFYYVHLLQAFVYSVLGDRFHEESFLYHNRNFKLFALSEIYSRTVRKKGDRFIFGDEIHFYFSTPCGELFESFLRGLFERMRKRETVNFCNNPAFIKAVELIDFPYEDYYEDHFNFRNGKKEFTFYTLTPISVYSTEQLEDGRKFVRYYSPVEESFSRHVKENLRRKVVVYQQCEEKFVEVEERDVEEMEIRILSKKRVKERVKYFVKDGVKVFTKGYEGIFSCRCSLRLMKFIWLVGLGAKNTQGFGMIDFVV